MGIDGATWESCARGINVGRWGLSVQTEGLAKFGQLYLQKGAWKGRPILPAAWVQEGTTFKIQQPMPAQSSRPKEENDWLQGYCYQFWRSRHHAFRGDGAFGQFSIVMPDYDAVIALTGGNQRYAGRTRPGLETFGASDGRRSLSCGSRVTSEVAAKTLDSEAGTPERAHDPILPSQRAAFLFGYANDRNLPSSGTTQYIQANA